MGHSGKELLEKLIMGASPSKLGLIFDKEIKIEFEENGIAKIRQISVYKYNRNTGFQYFCYSVGRGWYLPYRAHHQKPYDFDRELELE